MVVISRYRNMRSGGSAVDARYQEKDFGKNGLASDKRFVKDCNLVLDHWR